MEPVTPLPKRPPPSPQKGGLRISKEEGGKVEAFCFTRDASLEKVSVPL